MFLKLNWKEFNRSKSLGGKTVAKVFKWFGIVYVAILSLAWGIILSWPKEEDVMAPFLHINKQLIYGLVYLVVMRYFIQSLPVLNIKPLLLTPLLKKKIVRYVVLKTVPTYFNILPLFFLIPFSINLSQNDEFSALGLIFWNINLVGLIYLTNFFNFLLNNKRNLIYVLGAFLALIKALDYY